MQDKKIFVSLAAALALTAGFTSCSSDEELGQADNGGRTPIRLTSSVATRAISQNLQDAQIAAGVRVGVFAQSNAAAIENGDNNALTADGSGNFTGQTMYFPEEGGVSIYAYAPYNSAWAGQLNSDQTFTVATDQSTDEGYLASDLLLGTPSAGNPVASTGEVIQLDFKHKLTKLNLDVNLGQSGVDLKGATVSVAGVLTSATVNVATGEVGSAQGSASDITAARFASDATIFTASAIFVPQTVLNGNTFVVVETAGGTSYKAALGQDVTFEGGKKYTYTVQFTGGGDEPVGIELKLGSVVDVWEDGTGDLGGDAEETVTYGVGDYMLSDGTFVKSGETDVVDPSNIVAVVFSKSVATADAQDGYNAYAMALRRVKGKLGFEDRVCPNVSDFEELLADLDGRAKTAELMASEAYANLGADAKAGTILDQVANYSATYAVSSTVSSDWFLPSIGQLIQVLNNIGEAGITSATEVNEGNRNSPWWTTTDRSAIEKLDACITAAGVSSQLPIGNINIASSSEANTSLFGIVLKAKDGGDGTQVFDSWSFGRSLSKVNTDCSIFPCVAVKLPVAE